MWGSGVDLSAHYRNKWPAIVSTVISFELHKMREIVWPAEEVAPYSPELLKWLSSWLYLVGLLGS